MSPTHAESLFGKSNELLSDYENELIDRMLEIDNESRDVSGELRELLLIGIDQYSGSVKNYINQLDIPHREKELILGLYTTTIAYSIEKAVEDLYESSLHLVKDNGRLYTFILSDTLITILNGILSFEKKIDSMSPGLTSVLLNITYTASCTALTLCEPVIGLLIQASGVMIHTKNFLQIEKLEKTIETMRSDLAAIRKHKELEKIEKVGISIQELAQSIGTKPSLIQHLFPNGLTTSVIEAIPTIKLLEKSLKSPEQQHLLQNLFRYIENNLPIDKKLISDKYENIGNKIIRELKNIGINEQSIELKQIQYITAIINSSLQSHAPIFDKIATLQKGANEIQAIVNQVILEKKNDPRYADQQFIDQALQAIEQTINEDIRGNLKDINLSLIEETKISPDIQKLLGINDNNKAELHKAEILADTYSDKTNRLQEQKQKDLEQLAVTLDLPHTELLKIFQNDIQLATKYLKNESRNLQKQYLKKLCEYTQENVPTTKEGVEGKFNQLDNEMIRILKQYKSPTNDSIEIEKCINKEKNFLIESLTKSKPIFEKIADIEKSTKNLNYSIKKHISSFPKNIQYSLSATFEKTINNNIKGDLDEAIKFFTKYQRFPKKEDNDLLKKTVGINYANERLLNKGIDLKK